MKARLIDLDAAVRQNFFVFVRKVFDTLHGRDKPFIDGLYIVALCWQLEQAARGHKRRLLISIPPRHLKSITAAVALAAWILGRTPGSRIMVATYGEDLSRQHAHNFRRVVTSNWYNRAFPGMRIDPRHDRLLEIGTTAGGSRKAVSPMGPSTGFGCDFLIIDDLMKAADAGSEVERERVREFYRNLTTRFDDKRYGVITSIQQRLHEDDLPAYLLEQGGFEHFELKAIAERDEEYPLYAGRTARRRAGEALFPQREPLEELERIRRELGPVDFAAQYQQSPTAPGGNVVRWDWFHFYEEAFGRSDYIWVVQSWDTAVTAEPKSDFSACSTWGYRDGCWHLIDIWRGRLEYPALRRKIAMHATDHRADQVLIELAGTGHTLVQELRPKANSRYLGMRPGQHKVERMIAQTGKIESGDVRLPRAAAWLEEFRQEISSFPNGRFDDQVDSVSQFLRYLDLPSGRRLVNTDPQTGRRRMSPRRRNSS